MKWFLFTLPLMAVITLGACDNAGPLDPVERADRPTKSNSTPCARAVDD